MENYEIKYKEALERMKSWVRGEHPECFCEAQKTAEFIFPELKESEDERIRKRLICGMNALKEQKKETFATIPIDDAIAWLEKQGKRLDANDVTKPHWISVEDELPKEHFKDSSSKWVLVCTPLGSVYIDSYNHKNKEWVNNRKSVTHWMPMPSVEHLRESTKMIEKGGEE